MFYLPTDKCLEIINSELYTEEIKLFLILMLVHDERMGLYSAYELCEKQGLMIHSWLQIEKYLMSI